MRFLAGPSDTTELLVRRTLQPSGKSGGDACVAADTAAVALVAKSQKRVWRFIVESKGFSKKEKGKVLAGNTGGQTTSII